MAKKYKTKKKRKKRIKIGRIMIIIFLIYMIVSSINKEDFVPVANRNMSDLENIEKEEQIEENLVEEVIEEVIEDVIEINLVAMEEEIKEYLAEEGISEDNLSYAVEMLGTQYNIFLNEDEYFTAASIYKLPLSMLYYDMINSGEVTLSTTYEYKSSYNEDIGVLASKYSPGAYVPLDYVLEVVIVNSDNTAGHLLFEELGGFSEYQKLLNTYSDFEFSSDFYEAEENKLSASYVNDVLRYIYENEDDYELLVEDMKIATRNMYLDVDIDSAVAQKYGMYGSALNASGIVYASNPYSISIFTALGMNTGQEVIAQINQICYKYFNEEV